MKKLFFLIIITLFCSIAFSESIYPTTVAEFTGEILLKGNGKISDLKNGEEARFQTLTFQNSPYQKINSIQEMLIINGQEIKPTYTLDEFNNKYVNFLITQNGDFEYYIKANITRKSIIYDINDYEIKTPTGNELDYTTKSEKIESESTEITTLAKNKLQNTTLLQTLNDAVFWVNDYIKYASGDDFQKYYLLQRTAIETLLDKKGVCDEFANLAAAILRAKKVPVRIAIGITFDGKEWGNHAWIDIYHKDLGWIPSDPTFRESGFVDATHIKLGSFKDVSESQAKCVYPETANCTFNAQNSLPEVNIIQTKYFSQVKISTKTEEIYANRWNDIILEVENKTEGTLSIPISIKENYQGISIQQKTQAIILEKGKKGTITFKIYPSIDLKQNEIAKGTITFNTLAEPYQKELTIKPGKTEDNGKVIVLDITPIATEEQLFLDISIGNYTQEEAPIDINIIDTQENYYWKEKIESFSTQSFRKEIQIQDTTYNVTIDTPTETATITIYPTKQTITIKDTPKQTTVIQKIQPPTADQSVDLIKEHPELLAFALLPAVAVIILGIYLVKRRYV